jgi:hypothetical protein
VAAPTAGGGVDLLARGGVSFATATATAATAGLRRDGALDGLGRRGGLLTAATACAGECEREDGD